MKPEKSVLVSYPTYSIQRIGFQGFRKFKEYAEFPLGCLNVFVGKNNSGKSTAIKALLLAIKNVLTLKSFYNLRLESPLSSFSFLNTFSFHAHLGNFWENLSDGVSKDAMFISISFGYDNADHKLISSKSTIKFTLDGSSLSAYDPALSIPLKRLCAAYYEHPFWKRPLAELSYDYSDSNDPEPILSYYKQGLRLFQSYWEDSPLFKNEYERDYYQKKSTFEGNLRVISSAYAGHTFGCVNENEIINREVALSSNDLEEKRLHHRTNFSDMTKTISEEDDFFEYVGDGIQTTYKHIFVRYIETHNASHNEVLFEEDKNNYLAQTVALFEGLHIQRDDNKSGTIVFKFLLKWMCQFGLGEDFRITRPFSEVLRVEMFSSGKWRPLGAIGTGSVQMFILLLQIGMALFELRLADIEVRSGRAITLSTSIIIIEEPEQNLHPALQSLLADLFLDAIRLSDNRIQFVVETHSEYMVRRTQVIVSEMVRNSNLDIDSINDLMKVYYFPTDGQPYSMDYRSSGQFDHQFGPGFFDEAGKNYRALLENDV